MKECSHCGGTLQEIGGGDANDLPIYRCVNCGRWFEEGSSKPLPQDASEALRESRARLGRP